MKLVDRPKDTVLGIVDAQVEVLRQMLREIPTSPERIEAMGKLEECRELAERAILRSES